MRLASDKCAPENKNLTPVHLTRDIGSDQYPSRPKFPISMEKKIEHLWLESEARGWNFNEFVVVVMEVLTVMHHRNKLRNNEHLQDKNGFKKRA